VIPGAQKTIWDAIFVIESDNLEPMLMDIFLK
jgi:hypothetical protein